MGVDDLGDGGIGKPRAGFEEEGEGEVVGVEAGSLHPAVQKEGFPVEALVGGCSDRRVPGGNGRWI